IANSSTFLARSELVLRLYLEIGDHPIRVAAGPHRLISCTKRVALWCAASLGWKADFRCETRGASLDLLWLLTGAAVHSSNPAGRNCPVGHNRPAAVRNTGSDDRPHQRVAVDKCGRGQKAATILSGRALMTPMCYGSLRTPLSRGWRKPSII